MKLLATLLAVGQASQTSWAVNTWWEKANDVYDWAVANPDDFAAIIASADDSNFQPVWNFCGGDDDTIVGDEITTCGAQIANFVGMSTGKPKISLCHDPK